jgi:acylglycerol lipase
LAHRLSKDGYTCVGFDQRGHGKSEGEKGYLDDYKLVLLDTSNFISQIMKLYSGTPIFFFGQGAGSLIALAILK